MNIEISCEYCRLAELDWQGVGDLQILADCRIVDQRGIKSVPPRSSWWLERQICQHLRSSHPLPRGGTDFHALKAIKTSGNNLFAGGFAF